MNELTGTTNYQGKKFSVTMATNDAGNGLWEEKHRGAYTKSGDNWKPVYELTQTQGTCQFSAGNKNKNLKKAIREKLLERIADEFDIYFHQGNYDSDYNCEYEHIKFRVSW